MFDQATILLVEDNSADLLLIKRSFLKAKILNTLEVVTSGEEAIAYLSGAGKYKNRTEFPLPSLVLLDIQMPGIDGFEVLKWMRQQPIFGALRVVMLTSSDAMRDVNMAYQLGANSFLIKPVDFERFMEISQALGGCWCWLNQPEPISLEPEQPARSDTEILRKVNYGVERSHPS